MDTLHVTPVVDMPCASRGREGGLVGRLWSHWELSFQLCSITYLLCDKRSFLFSDMTHSLSVKIDNPVLLRWLAHVLTKPSLAHRSNWIDTILHLFYGHPYFLLLHRGLSLELRLICLSPSLQNQINSLSIFPCLICVKITKTQPT